MELLTEEAAAAAQPTDKELADYLAANPAAFRAEPRITFSQEFLGGRLAMVEPRYENVRAERSGARVRTRVRGGAGKAVARALGRADRLRIGRAPGPGREFVPGGLPPLAEVRPLVEREWRNAKRKALSEEQYARLRSRYTVKVAAP